MDDRTRVLAMLWQRRADPVPLEGLQGALDLFYGADAPDGVASVARLRSEGRLPPEGLVPTDPEDGATAQKIVMRAGFDAALVELATSAAMRRYNARVNGWERFSFDMVDGPQREALLAACDLRPGDRFVDLGCATGGITDWLAEATGASGLGVDFAASAVALAAEWYPRCTFAVADMDALELGRARFEAVVAVDTLYFPADLAATLGRVRDALVDGGRLVALYSRSAKQAGIRLSFAQTPLGEALAATGFEVEAHDRSDDGERIWRTGALALRELESAFDAEGLRHRWERLGIENRAQLAAVDEGRQHRWLVIAR